MSTPEVVVTGLGMTTPVGGDVASSWSAILAGQSGVRPIDAEWIAEQPSRIAGQLAVEPSEVLTKVETRRLDRSQQAAVIAAREAWQDAGAPAVQPERLGAVIGTGIGGVTSLLDAYDTLNERGWSRVSPHMVTMIMPNGPAAVVGLEIGARAGVHSPVSACASGAEAIANAARMIRDGRADVVLTGGTEAVICGITMAGFSAMRALSTRNDDPTAASRPYDTDRDGFVMGEGAGIVVLESRQHAQARGASIYGVYGGAGMTSDGHHIAQPDPEGGGAARAMTAALADAGVSTADVHHVNAHATSTPQGDIAEAVAIRRALGSHADQALVTGTKSMTGHLLGGAGAIESIFTILALRDRTAPPTINLENIDPEIHLPVAANSPHELPSGDIAALNNSFGFGGHDVALVFRSA
ncbi:MAG: beta-ketoacyl-ACP synthase II [Candidatus Nanopelagicales bacterium]|nr:beta-ketoacyl-ACP synthase II [Candidatus Nanopelagicales bacterium]NKB91082.1 beta-ketoacyl-ACP synthase II [Candidatus Nanopelagicales bacterium]